MIHVRKAFKCICFLISLSSGPLCMNQVREIAWAHWHPFMKIKEMKDLKSNLIDLPPSPYSLPERTDWQQGVWELKGHRCLMNSGEDGNGLTREKRAQWLVSETQEKKKGHCWFPPKFTPLSRPSVNHPTYRKLHGSWWSHQSTASKLYSWVNIPGF